MSASSRRRKTRFSSIRYASTSRFRWSSQLVSLFGVAFAGIVAASGSDAPLALVAGHFETYAMWIGPLVFAAMIAWL
jgi:hypothetical protein